VGDLGQVLFCPFELADEDSIRRAVQHSNIVINLIGRGIETKNFSYKDVNVDGPERIARICKEMGVQRLVHMSHINARAEPERIFLPKGSEFLRTKYMGELAVRDQFPEATIFRCADVYGQGDTFLNQLFSLPFRGRFPLYLKGKYTVKRPVHLTDVTSGIMNSLYDPSAVGETYEAVGPESVTMHDLVRYIFELTNRSPQEGNFNIVELMTDPAVFAKAFVTGNIPFGGLNLFHQFNLDGLERMNLSDESQDLPDLTDLGVQLSTLQKKMPWEVNFRDFYGYYVYETVEELPNVAPCKNLSFSEERQLFSQKANGLVNLLPQL